MEEKIGLEITFLDGTKRTFDTHYWHWEDGQVGINCEIEGGGDSDKKRFNTFINFNADKVFSIEEVVME